MASDLRPVNDASRQLFVKVLLRAGRYRLAVRFASS
jgi:hypothetical protein